MNRLKEKYLKEVVPSLKEKYNYKSIMEVPKLEKIVVNIGVGDATTNSKLLAIAFSIWSCLKLMDPKIKWFSKPKGMVSKEILGPREKLL